MKNILAALLLLVPASAWAQERIDSFATGSSQHFRGLSPAPDGSLWVSGTRGTVGRWTNPLAGWTWFTVPGMETRDLRDIEAFDSLRAVVLVIDAPGHLLKTTDGGKSWRVIFTDSSKGVFFDAMDFDPRTRKGVLVGDPLNGRQYVLDIDFDNETVKRRSLADTLHSGEAFFAASGANVQLLPKGGFVAVTGGQKSRLLKNGKPQNLPLIQGADTRGANAIAVLNERTWYVVGGDFSRDTDTTANAVYTLDAGRTWKRPLTPPAGYRSSVVWLDARRLVACGTSGVDVSYDGGLNWKNISTTGYHAAAVTPKGTVILAGPRGRIAKLSLRR